MQQSRADGGADGFRTVPLAPPPEVLSTLQELFARHPSRCVKAHLRRYGATHLVPHLRHPRRAPGFVLHLLESSKPDVALWLMRLANDIGYHFSPKFYSHVAGRMSSQKRWRDVLRVTYLARQSLGYTTTALLNWRLQALAEIPHLVPVQDALALFEKERVNPSRLTYHHLISMHLRNRDLTSAVNALQLMESSGFPVTDKTCAIILLGYRSFGLTPDVKAQALAALARTTNRKVAGTILNGLIQLMLDAGDFSGVVEVLSSVSSRLGDPFSDLGADITQGDDAICDPPGAVSTPIPHKALVDVTTYNTLLEHLSPRGDVPRAIQVLRHMLAEEVAPDSRTAASLVRLYFAAGFANDALHVVSSVLHQHAEAVTFLPSLGFMSPVPPQHPIPPPTPPTIHVFNALLQGVLPQYKLNGLHAVLSMMRITGINADATTLTTLLSHKQRRERAASREMIRIVRILMSFGVTPTMQHLHILLRTLSSRSREVAYPRGWRTTLTPTPSEASEPADKTFVDRAETFHPAAGVTFPHHRKHGNLLRPILQSLADRGVKSDRVTFAMRIKHDALVKHDMETAMQTFRTMIDAGLQPTIYHYGALMEGYVAAGNVLAAAKVMRMAAEAGVRADVKTHTILISGWARLARPTMAVKAFRNMVAEGLRPDVPAIDALVSAFFRVRAYGVARRVLLRLWSQVGSLTAQLSEASLRELAVAFRALHWPNAVVREKLTYSEQQALRKTIREISRTWRDVMTKGLKAQTRRRGPREHRAARDVTTHTTEYTRAREG